MANPQSVQNSHSPPPAVQKNAQGAGGQQWKSYKCPSFPVSRITHAHQPHLDRRWKNRSNFCFVLYPLQSIVMVGHKILRNTLCRFILELVLAYLGFGEISCTKKYVSQYVTSCYLRYLVQRNMFHRMSLAVGDKIEVSYQKRKIQIASNEMKCKSRSGNRIAGLPLREVCAAPARRQFCSSAAHARHCGAAQARHCGAAHARHCGTALARHSGNGSARPAGPVVPCVHCSRRPVGQIWPVGARPPG